MRRNSFKVGPSGFTIISPKPQTATNNNRVSGVFRLSRKSQFVQSPQDCSLGTATMQVTPDVQSFFCNSSTVCAVIRG